MIVDKASYHRSGPVNQYVEETDGDVVIEHLRCYAPEYNPLWDPELPPDQQPNVIGRARFGRITIANADSGGGAYTDVAIDQAYRAVSEVLALPA